MKVVIFGLSITSSWGNGHATTYRSLSKGLAKRGHKVTFIERDVEWYRNNRDQESSSFWTVFLYRDISEHIQELIQMCEDADAIVVGSYYQDAIAVTQLLLDKGYGPILFYDIDTPITIGKLRNHESVDYLEASLIPFYDAYMSFAGGPILAEIEQDFHSPLAVPLYCSVDLDLYYSAGSTSFYASDLSYLGTYAADRQAKLTNLLNDTATKTPSQEFIVAGPQYPADLRWAANVRHIEHVPPAEHPAFYSSSRFTLNLTRSDMVASGFSPSVRLFEASACGATILSDSWKGLEQFLSPGEEILLPQTSAEVAVILTDISEEERRRIGRRAKDRILSEHTSVHRAIEFESVVLQCASGSK